VLSRGSLAAPGDAAHWLMVTPGGARRSRHAIPERLDRKSQDVEADGDVAHRAGANAVARSSAAAALTAAPQVGRKSQQSANTAPA